MRKGGGIGIVCILIAGRNLTDAFFSSVNIPWPEAGMEDADYLYVFYNIVMPIAMEYSPELVFSEVISQYQPAQFLIPSQYLQVSMLQMGMTSESAMSRLPDTLT